MTNIFKFKKVIITGASGFIGGSLAKRLLSDGVKVYGIGRNREKLDDLKQYGDFIPIEARFEQYNQLPEMISERDFDMFWHLAWQGTSKSTYNDYNVQVENIKVACDAISSAAKMGCQNSSMSGSIYQHCAEPCDQTFNPMVYGVIKKCALDLFKNLAYKNSINCSNIIISNTFGVGDKLNTAIVFFIRRLLANEPLNLVSGDCLDDWIYIDDMVEGILCAASLLASRPLEPNNVCKNNYSGNGHNAYFNGYHKDYYIGNRNITTFKEKLETMKSVLSSKSELKFGTYPQTSRVDYSNFDLEALCRDTGFQVRTDFVTNILKTAQWLNSF